METITNNWDIIIFCVGAGWVVINWVDSKIEGVRKDLERETDETTRKVSSAHNRIDRANDLIIECKNDHIALLTTLLNQKQ